MRPRSIRTLAVAVTLAVFSAHAEDPEGLRLKLEKQMHLAPTRPERDSAKFLEADRIEGAQDRNVIATGNVTLRQRGATIRADRLDYSSEDQKAVATGHVRLERDGDVARGPELTYRLDNDTGEMESPIFEFAKTPERRTASRGQASRALLEEDRRNRLFQAEYTSCPAPRDDWFIRVHELEIDTSRNVGTSYTTTVFFLGLPILYLPYMTFALDNKRRSGFLAPTFGTSGQSGFEASLPYYWNIAPNMDATLTPKIFTKRGEQLGTELRYLYPKFSGELDTEFLPHDKIAERDRYFVGWRHAQQLWPGWSFALNAQKVSDDNYFRDLTTKIALTSQTNLPRDATIAYANDVWTVSARVLGYQTLQDPLNQVPIPYNILPQILATGSRQNVYGFDWLWTNELSNFRHPTLPNGQRFITYPSISYPMRWSYGFIIPKFGYHFTRYNMQENASGGLPSATRDLPITSLDAGLFFERPTTWGGRSFTQTLEPRLFYLNVPFRDQTQLPNFTTAETDFNFQRIFAENRFVGGDRIGDANQLTLALTSRMIESATGLERFKAGIGQVYYFRPPQVTLSNTAPPSDKTSDILGFASSQMSPSVSIDAGWQYTPNLSRSEKVTVGGRYSPAPGSIFNAAYRYARESDPTNPSLAGIQQVDFSTQWPILRNVTALARWNWSIKDRKLLEGLAGFEYNAGCWQVRAVAHRFITATQTYSTSFQIQLELSGLSRIGINPLETIRQNISGYRRSDELSQ
ncbi:MAG: LPS-assembly protein LptD [Usitatibacter sp.]